MKTFVIGYGAAYLLILVLVTILARRGRNMNLPREFLGGGPGFGAFLSFIGISATLFSAFTLQGMPAFFYNHGAAAWIFLGVTDVCLAAILMWGGLKLRRVAGTSRTKAAPVRHITDLLRARGSDTWVRWVYVLAVTLFLLPYVTIQIKGASLIMHSQLPIGNSHLIWSILIVLVLAAYGFLSGLRGVYLTDSIQGSILLFAVLFVSLSILRDTGIQDLFNHVEAVDKSLLSAPGPMGVLGWQFLLISFIAICLMPYTQPQLATRVLAAKSDRALITTCIGLAVFAFVVILPTLIIGFRGVAVAPSDPAGFLIAVLQQHVPHSIAGLFLIGILAAAMSTADSQVLAIGTEWATAIGNGPAFERKSMIPMTKLVAALVLTIALVFAQSDFKSLVLFSVNSFIGTSLLLPLIIGGCSGKHGRPLVWVSVALLAAFLLALIGVIPNKLLGFRLELMLFTTMGVATAIFLLLRHSVSPQDLKTVQE